MFVRDIQRAVAEHHGVPLRVMFAQHGCRSTEIPQRQQAMCLSIRLTDHSFQRIGDFFGGRDPTTVRHAMHAAERRPEAKEAMRQVTLRLLKQEHRL